jgi:hypothetical protein
MDEEIDQSHSNGKAVVDRIAEIEQLAALDPIDYEAARVAASNRLGIRSHILDKQVARRAAPLVWLTMLTTARAARSRSLIRCRGLKASTVIASRKHSLLPSRPMR